MINLAYNNQALGSDAALKAVYNKLLSTKWQPLLGHAELARMIDLRNTVAFSKLYSQTFAVGDDASLIAENSSYGHLSLEQSSEVLNFYEFAIGFKTNKRHLEAAYEADDAGKKLVLLRTTAMQKLYLALDTWFLFGTAGGAGRGAVVNPRALFQASQPAVSHHQFSFGAETTAKTIIEAFMTLINSLASHLTANTVLMGRKFYHYLVSLESTLQSNQPLLHSLGLLLGGGKILPHPALDLENGTSKLLVFDANSQDLSFVMGKMPYQHFSKDDYVENQELYLLEKYSTIAGNVVAYGNAVVMAEASVSLTA